jgi:hypothetical protein
VDRSAALENSGIRTTFQVVHSPPPDGFCISSWASETLDDGLWGQVGYSDCVLDGAEQFNGFYQVYRDSFEMVDGEIPITEGLHSFAMALTSGTTWTFAMDGLPFGALDMGTTFADGAWTQIMTEEEPAPYYSPPTTAFPEAMSLLHDGIWMQPAKAVIFNSLGVPGVSGNQQDPTLVQNGMRISGSDPLLPPNTTLWDGPLTPSTYVPVSASSGGPFVMLESPAAGSTVSGTLTLDVIATSPQGIANVVFWLGGSKPRCVVTAAPFMCEWDSTKFHDGAHWVQFVVTDTSGQQTWVYDHLVIRNH